ncbi:ribonucleoside-diphosphate reductase, adenosylcobalamin-dependent [archaeon]|nr:ribonucleoside-diphosphate reductase, adenosylcobalamin-dependent [archaeon]|tara:strand:- start:2453 stop:5038 length:2586 start_codon:yes stop_codon:yes gene_type:complete
MITKVQKADGTVVDFDKDFTISSLSHILQEKASMAESEAVEIATNIVKVIDNREIETPSTTDFEQLVNLVVTTTKLASKGQEVANEETITELESNTEEVQTQTVSETEEKNEEVVEEILTQETATELQTDLKHLQEHNIDVNEQATRILSESTVFDELGRSIFLDRYSLKCKRDDIEQGDLVIAITKEDPKYPKKDLGIVKSIEGDKFALHMITGMYADTENNYEFTTSIWKCDKPIESIKQAHKRIAHAASTMEKTPELQEKWEAAFFEELSKKHIQPAGRIMTGANVGEGYTQNLTLYNCYVIPSPQDSREGIIQETLHQMTEIMSRGGGVGINLSTLRPRYSYVQGVHGKSSGAVSWGGLYSYTTALIEQGGSRRGALMLMLQDWHPDVIEFISAKRKKGMIENANISVLFSDKFMEALSKGEDWNLEFPDYEAAGIKPIYKDEWTGDIDLWKSKGYPTKIYNTIPASEIWDQVISSAHASAEPGLVFMERYNKMSNSYYFNPIICTNPCGEQGLPAWGVCNLGHLYLASFARKVGEDEIGPLYEINWSDLKKATATLSRFLDNVIDLTPYHFQENEDNQKGERRIGLGTLGLGELLIKLRLRYGSPESLELIDEIYKQISLAVYKSSIELSKEKGMFPKCDPEKIVKSGFIQTLPEELQAEIVEHGLRNVTLTTQAPTGTVGTMLGTSTGIEPYYAFEFFRQSRLGFHKVNIPLAEGYKDSEGNLPDFFVTAMQMTPLDHIRVQAAVQRWTDSSISKTANAPEDFTVEQTKQLYEEAYRLGCKGVTIYRDNCRYEQVLTTDAETEEKNANNGDWEASNKVEAKAELAAVSETEETIEGGKCELKFDENGQMFKSCSD